MDIRLDIGAMKIRERSLLDIRGCTDNSTRTSVIFADIQADIRTDIQADIRTDSSTRGAPA